MTRVFFTIDETNPLKPIPCLHINGCEMKLTEREFMNLMNDMHWVKGHMDGIRSTYFSNLANKYKECSCVATAD